jgi:hypothetical protein
MSSEIDAQAILKRLQALEEENARLRTAAKPKAEAKLTVIEGEYNGHPTLTFQGPFRQFTLGIKKLSVVKEAWPQVESFLQRNFKGGKSLAFSDDEDVKI